MINELRDFSFQAVDSISTGRVLKAIIQMLFDVADWESLNEHILVLTKRRSQLKTVSTVTKYVCNSTEF